MSVRAAFDHHAVVQDADDVSVLNGGEPVSDGDGRAVLLSAIERFLHDLLALGVQRAGRCKGPLQRRLRAIREGLPSSKRRIFGLRISARAMARKASTVSVGFDERLAYRYVAFARRTIERLSRRTSFDIPGRRQSMNAWDKVGDLHRAGVG